MIVHPHPDPVAFELFGLPIRWYGLMYLAGFCIARALAQYLTNRPAFSGIHRPDVENILVFAVVGVVVGGRLGYVLFYNPVFFWHNPLDIFNLGAGGMSFHGGLIGVIVSLWVFSEKGQFLRLADFAAVLTPPGLGLGRLGNFINGELPGRVASENLPWAFNFGVPDSLPRHPSQLYQFFIEGILLTALMLYLARRPHRAGYLAGVFLLAYGGGRFFVEFFREPDAHLGTVFAGLSMGQLLSLPMPLVGVVLIFYKYKWGGREK